jgi:glycosyltransferase involved in cell wall biosynthesis
MEGIALPEVAARLTLILVVDDFPSFAGQPLIVTARMRRGLSGHPTLDEVVSLIRIAPWSKVVIVGGGELFRKLQERTASDAIDVELIADAVPGHHGVCRSLGLAAARMSSEHAFVVDVAVPGVLLDHLARQLELVIGGAELSIVARVPHALTGIVANRSALARFAAAWTKLRELDFQAGLFEAFAQLRATFQVGEVSASQALGWGRTAPVTPTDARAEPPAPPASRGEPSRGVGANRKLLCVQYTTRTEPGGTKAFLTVVRGLVARGWDITVVIPGPGAITRPLADLGVRVREVFFTPAFANLQVVREMSGFYQECIAMRQLIASEAPSLVYIGNGAPSVSLASAMLGLPTVLHLHVWLTNMQPEDGYRKFDRVGFALHDRVMTSGVWIQDRLRTFVPMDPERITGIPCGIELANYQDRTLSTAEARQRLGLGADPIVLGVISVVLRFKRIHIAIEALAAARRAGVPAQLVIAGNHTDQDYYAALKARVRELDLENHVRFLGHFKEVNLIYRASDLFINCSLDDAYPQVTMEAMTFGCPVVAFRSGGLVEQIRHGETGILLPPDQPDGGGAILGETIVELWKTPEKFGNLVAPAQRHALDNFSEQRFVARVEAVLQGAIAEAATRTRPPE